MAKKIKGAPEYSIYDLDQLHLKKCYYCKGRDGKNKDIYETLDFAMATIKHLERERNIYLNPYPCPYGKGYHLTKNNAGAGIGHRKEIIFQNNGIPLKSSGKSNIPWEYAQTAEDDHEENSKAEPVPRSRKNNTEKDIPIVKTPPEEHNRLRTIEGKVVEIIEKIDIGNYFNVNPENTIVAVIFKDLLRDTICQLTVYADSGNKNTKNSFTILAERRLLRQNKIAKGNVIKITIRCKSYNNSKIWLLEKVIGLIGS
jgi:hypothetical protein